MVYSKADLMVGNQPSKNVQGLQDKYKAFLTKQGLFTISPPLKEFYQAEELEKQHLPASGACYGLSLDWIRRLLKGNGSNYFDKKFKNVDDRSKLLHKAYAIHQAAEKAEIASNINLSDANLQKGMQALKASLTQHKYRGLQDLTITRIDKRWANCDAWEMYEKSFDEIKTTYLPTLRPGEAAIISAVPYFGKNGHAVAVCRVGTQMLFFDPNIGQRQYKANEADSIADAITAGLIVGAGLYNRVMRFDRVTKGGLLSHAT